MCKVEWCENKPDRSGKGYCRRHYDQIRKHGEILTTRSRSNPNEIIIYEDYAELILRDRQAREVARAKIDIQDIEIAKKFKWSLHTNGYVRCMHKGKTKYLHRIVMDTPNDKEIDHINLDKLDNRKMNLRECEHHQNCFNRKSMHRGITLVKSRKLTKPYNAKITVKGDTIHLGYFSTYEEALKVRLEAEAKHHKEFRYSV